MCFATPIRGTLAYAHAVWLHAAATVQLQRFVLLCASYASSIDCVHEESACTEVMNSAQAYL